MPKRYYVYILDDWISVPRWVGVGVGRRLYDSGTHADGNAAKAKFIAETTEKLGTVPCRVIQYNLTKRAAYELEKQLIREIGRQPNGPLCNLAEGGKGPTGVTRSESYKAKVSASLTGRKLSPDHVAAIAAASTGRTQSDDVKERKNAKLRGRKRTPAQLERIRAAVARRPSRKGIPLTPDQRANQSTGAKARWERDPTPRAAKGPDGRFTQK